MAQQTPRSALVLAAGYGTRMRPLTDSCPKPLLQVGGRTLLDRAIDRVREANTDRVVVNTHYLAEQVRDHLAHRHDVDIAISHEPELLETGGAVTAALPLLGDGPIFVVNSDALWTDISPLRVLAEEWTRRDADALLLLATGQQAIAHHGAGDFTLRADGCLLRAGTDDGELNVEEYIYTGAQILSSAVLSSLPSGSWSINALWDQLISNGRMQGIAMPTGRWVNVGTPEGLREGEAALASATDN